MQSAKGSLYGLWPSPTSVSGHSQPDFTVTQKQKCLGETKPRLAPRVSSGARLNGDFFGSQMVDVGFSKML